MSEKRVKEISLPLREEDIAALRAGDTVLLTGTMLTGRDAAHLRFAQEIANGRPLPVDIAGETIYYVGPAPAPDGKAMGSAGPTSSYRMDSIAPTLLKMGLRGMVGKGRRSEEVMRAIREHRCVYFAAIGGAGALLSQRILGSETLCYPKLGTESVCRIQVEKFPAVVAADIYGGDLYKSSQREYASGRYRKTDPFQEDK